MTFMKTVCIDEKIWGGKSYDYDDVADGDYIVFALWDITDICNPKLIMCDDNTHTSIASDIESFIKGIRYCIDIDYYSRNILLCENEYKPEFKLNKLIRCIGQGRTIMKKYYETPTQILFYDDNEWIGGIAYKDEIICGECGQVMKIELDGNIIPIKPLNWVDISAEIGGDEFLSAYETNIF